MVEMLTHLAIERAGLVPLHLPLRALALYPDRRRQKYRTSPSSAGVGTI